MCIFFISGVKMAIFLMTFSIIDHCDSRQNAANDKNDKRGGQLLLFTKCVTLLYKNPTEIPVTH
jgi:hypothetical protein